MKNVFFGILAVAFISLSSFTTDNSVETELKSCHYDIKNSKGIVIGQQTIIVNAATSCGSSEAKSIAISAYNATH